MAEKERCPFTFLECDGGEIYPDGTIGCAFKENRESECSWLADVPEFTTPRDFYNATAMKATMEAMES